MSPLQDPTNACNGNGETSNPAEISLEQILNTYEKAKDADGLKDTIIEVLIARCQRQQTQRICDQEIVSYIATLEAQTDALRQELLRVQVPDVNDKYVLVLLDGNGLIFNNTLLQSGAEGGHQSADLLVRKIQLDIATQAPLVGPNVKIMTRIYADTKGLISALCCDGAISTPRHLEDFCRAFTSSSPSMDYVDVGIDRDMTKRKIAELLKLHLHDNRCLQIYLGCSHDETYTSLIEECIRDSVQAPHITLLKGPPFGERLRGLPFRHVDCGTLFRTGKLDRNAPNGIPTAFPPPIGTPFCAIPSSIHPSPSSINTATAHSPASLGAVSRHLHRSSTTPSSVDLQYGTPANAPKTWAELAQGGHQVAQTEEAKAAHAAAQQEKESKRAAAELRKRIVPAEKAQQLVEQGIIPRNVRGQRVDPPERDYDKEHVYRVRRNKWCIQHFLRSDCPYSSKCVHKHKPGPSAEDTEWLKLVARLQPCNNGPACDVVHCPYGHRCMAPVMEKDKQKRGKNCFLGDECKFDASSHGVDPTIVRPAQVW